MSKAGAEVVRSGPGRGDWIRTSDPLLPKQVRYQTALHPGGSAGYLWRGCRSVKCEPAHPGLAPHRKAGRSCGASCGASCASARGLERTSIDQITTVELIVLITSGLVAGFVNTIAGGGSFLTLPALMLAGLPATEANATNRLAVLAQTGTATHGFHRGGHLDWRGTARLLMPTLIGAAIGAWLATEVPEAVMKPLLLGLLVVSAFLIAISSGPTREEDGAREPPGTLTRWVTMGACGFYGGFLQAGLGFAVLAAISMLHQSDLVRANATKALLLLPLTILSLGIFLISDLVVWAPGLVVAMASVVGTRLGLRVAMKRPEILRWILFGSVLLSAIALLIR